MSGWLIFIAILVGIWFFSWVHVNAKKAKKYDVTEQKYVSLKAEKDNLQVECERRESILRADRTRWQREVEQERVEREEKIQAIHALANEKSRGFPWLATAYADFFYLEDLRKAEFLESKSHPARRSAERIREIAAQRKAAEKLYRILRYKLEYYERLFPWLIDFEDEGIDDLIRQVLTDKEKAKERKEEPVDPLRTWLTEAEYEKLPRSDKFQLALERYWRKKKTKWEVGRDYERYVGYLYEKDGYSVFYQGIVEGLADLGRDLIAIRGGNTEIVQCKYWSKNRTIREKHIFQLFGTTVEYWLKNVAKRDFGQSSLFNGLLEEQRIKASFVTSTSLSDEAREFAKVLHINVRENFPLQRYPSVKCNVSRRTGERIYHLPFDQQYDTTVIEEERNECYVESVTEAETNGYRRAFRWRGDSPDEGD